MQVAHSGQRAANCAPATVLLPFLLLLRWLVLNSSPPSLPPHTPFLLAVPWVPFLLLLRLLSDGYQKIGYSHYTTYLECTSIQLWKMCTVLSNR